MKDLSVCKECGAKLSSDEIAINLILVSRTAIEFLCINCLAAKLSCSRMAIEDRIKYYRESGNCTNIDIGNCEMI